MSICLAHHVPPTMRELCQMWSCDANILYQPSSVTTWTCSYSTMHTRYYRCNGDRIWWRIWIKQVIIMEINSQQGKGRQMDKEVEFDCYNAVVSGNLALHIWLLLSSCFVFIFILCSIITKLKDRILNSNISGVLYCVPCARLSWVLYWWNFKTGIGRAK